MTSPEGRLEVLRQRWEQDPSSRIFLQLAEEYRRLGRLDEAAKVLEEGLGRQPHSLAAKVALGRCRLEMGQFSEASQQLEKVVAQDATQMVAYKLLVEAYLKQGEAEAASQRLDHYALLNSQDPEIETLRARIEALAEAPPVPPVEEAAPPTVPPPPAPVPAGAPPELPSTPEGSTSTADPSGEGTEEIFHLDTTELPVPDLNSLAPRPLRSAKGKGGATPATGAPPAEPPAKPQPVPEPAPGKVPPPPPDGLQMAGPPSPRPMPEGSAPDLAPSPGEEPGEGLPPGDLKPSAGFEVAPQAQVVEVSPGPEMAPPVFEEAEPPPQTGAGSSATLGELYLRQGHKKEAEEIFRQVLEQDPDNPLAREGLARATEETEEPLDAAHLLGDFPEGQGGLTEKKAHLLNHYLARLRRGSKGDDVS